MIASGGITKDVMSKVKVQLCQVCSLSMKAKSALCV